MNTFSSWSQFETITSRLVALLVIGMVSALPAVVSASSDTHANLFSGSEVAQLSTEQMSETRGQTNAVCYLGICISLADIGYEAYIQSPVGHISAPSTPATPATPAGPSGPDGPGYSGSSGSSNTWWGGNSGSFGGFSSSGSFSGGSYTGGFSGTITSVSSGAGGGNGDDLEIEVNTNDN